MANIRKRVGRKKGRATVRWQAVVRRGDHRPQYKTFKTKGEAEAWAASLENAIHRDKFTPSPEGKRHTVRDLLERYRKSEVPKKRDARNEGRYLDFWIGEIGEFKVASVTRAQIVEIRDRMAETKAPATVNRYLATLRHAYRLACTDWEWCTRSPCTKLALREPRGRDRHLNDKEITALLKAAKASEHPHLYPMVLIALTTGARRGEIEGLAWPDVDLKRGRAVLQKTKNTDKRSLVLVPQVIAELKVLKKVRRIDSDRIFETPNPDGKRTFPRLEDAWRAARSAAKLGDFRFHDLRHTFASRMAMDWHSLAEIAGALGHRTLAMVQRYSHLTEGHVQSAMESTAYRMLENGWPKMLENEPQRPHDILGMEDDETDEPHDLNWEVTQYGDEAEENFYDVIDVFIGFVKRQLYPPPWTLRLLAARFETFLSDADPQLLALYIGASIRGSGVTQPIEQYRWRRGRFPAIEDMAIIVAGFNVSLTFAAQCAIELHGLALTDKWLVAEFKKVFDDEAIDSMKSVRKWMDPFMWDESNCKGYVSTFPKHVQERLRKNRKACPENFREELYGRGDRYHI